MGRINQKVWCALVVPALAAEEVASSQNLLLKHRQQVIMLGEGIKVDWDGPNMKSTNRPEAERFVRRHNRAGWRA